ncbi:MAG: Peptidase C39 family protein [Methanosaeta sp. PtaU1.Bin112]|nr:MAG: Peptidase C39 family protein [Methanosaeta sp. PtaU1.Bin112]
MRPYLLMLVTCFFLVAVSWGGAAEQANPTNSSNDEGINTSINASTSLGVSNLALFSMPDTRQSTEYSCGAASLQAVLGYWGRDIGEEDIREMLNTNEESGTYPDDIIRVAKALGLEADYNENMTLADLTGYVAQGIPVIVDCQAWRSVSQCNESWADTWHNGHWMVVIGIDERNVTLEDPYILGDRGTMSREEFEARWHNVRGLDETDTVKQIHMGIAIRGYWPAYSSGFRHVD